MKGTFDKEQVLRQHSTSILKYSHILFSSHFTFIQIQIQIRFPLTPKRSYQKHMKQLENIYMSKTSMVKNQMELSNTHVEYKKLRQQAIKADRNKLKKAIDIKNQEIMRQLHHISIRNNQNVVSYNPSRKLSLRNGVRKQQEMLIFEENNKLVQTIKNQKSSLSKQGFLKETDLLMRSMKLKREGSQKVFKNTSFADIKLTLPSILQKRYEQQEKQDLKTHNQSRISSKNSSNLGNLLKRSRSSNSNYDQVLLDYKHSQQETLYSQDNRLMSPGGISKGSSLHYKKSNFKSKPIVFSSQKNQSNQSQSQFIQESDTTNNQANKQVDDEVKVQNGGILLQFENNYPQKFVDMNKFTGFKVKFNDLGSGRVVQEREVKFTGDQNSYSLQVGFSQLQKVEKIRIVIELLNQEGEVSSLEYFETLELSALNTETSQKIVLESKADTLSFNVNLSKYE